MQYPSTRRSVSDGLFYTILGLVIIILVIAFGQQLIHVYFDHWAPRRGGVGYDNFGWGILHGFFVPLDFLVSLFSDNLTFYQPHGTGNWYDFGFLLGAGILLRALTD